MPEVKYDPEVKILMITLSHEKIVDSDIIKNCVFDYDKDGNIVSIEVTDINLENMAKK